MSKQRNIYGPGWLDLTDGRAPNHPDFQRVAYSLDAPPKRKHVMRCPSCGADMHGNGCPFCGDYDCAEDGDE